MDFLYSRISERSDNLYFFSQADRGFTISPSSCMYVKLRMHFFDELPRCYQLIVLAPQVIKQTDSSCEQCLQCIRDNKLQNFWGLILLVDNTWGPRQKNAILTYMQEEGEMVNPLSAWEKKYKLLERSEIQEYKKTI